MFGSNVSTITLSIKTFSASQRDDRQTHKKDTYTHKTNAFFAPLSDKSIKRSITKMP